MIKNRKWYWIYVGIDSEKWLLSLHKLVIHLQLFMSWWISSTEVYHRIVSGFNLSYISCSKQKLFCYCSLVMFREMIYGSEIDLVCLGWNKKRKIRNIESTLKKSICATQKYHVHVLAKIKEEMRSMAFLTFRGGIHPYDGKDLSKTVLSRSICRREIWQFLFLSTSELRPSRS